MPWNSTLPPKGGTTYGKAERFGLSSAERRGYEPDMYQWRGLSNDERAELLAARKQNKLPWHRPPHWKHEEPARFHLSACYEHAPVIGRSPERMDAFANDLLSACIDGRAHLFAWCLLPNHYHLFGLSIRSREIHPCARQTTWRHFAGLEHRGAVDGAKDFARVADRHIRSEGHFWATMNYGHHNPVHHGYVDRWGELAVEQCASVSRGRRA